MGGSSCTSGLALDSSESMVFFGCESGSVYAVDITGTARAHIQKQTKTNKQKQTKTTGSR